MLREGGNVGDGGSGGKKREKSACEEGGKSVLRQTLRGSGRQSVKGGQQGQPIRRIQCHGRFIEGGENGIRFELSFGNHAHRLATHLRPEGKRGIVPRERGDGVEEDGGKISRLLVEVEQGGEKVEESRWRERGESGEGDGGEGSRAGSLLEEEGKGFSGNLLRETPTWMKRLGCRHRRRGVRRRVA